MDLHPERQEDLMTETITRPEIRVNGTAHRVEATPDTPLLFVLRNELGLNGAKYGCGLGVCGACAVLVDGQAVRSCMVAVGEVAGEVTTLEGLGSAENLHPLQRAFLDEQAAQCGYCTSGMIVTAAALLAANPDPDEDEIRAALDETLCRCGSHGRIVRAVQRAAKAMAGSPEGRHKIGSPTELNASGVPTAPLGGDR
jgi:nicotinate dehydrogenase subunit A